MANARPTTAKAKMPASALRYQSGFGNEFASEAVEGVLPRGQNSPQKVAHGLYAEQLSGTAFTAPRGVNRRTWLYRMRPSVAHKPFEPISPGRLRSAPLDEVPTPPNQLRWGPIPIPSPSQRTDFIDGLDRKSTRLNSSHQIISYAVFCLKKKNTSPPIARRYSCPRKAISIPSRCCPPRRSWAPPSTTPIHNPEWTT